MSNVTFVKPTGSAGDSIDARSGAEAYWPLLLAVAILGTLLVVVCLAGSIWAVCKIYSIKKYFRDSKQKRTAVHFPPAPRNNIPLTDIPSGDSCRENRVQVIPNIHALNEAVGASASLGYKNNPLQHEVPHLIPPHTWTPSPPFPPKGRTPADTLRRTARKCNCICDNCGNDQELGNEQDAAYNAIGMQRKCSSKQMLAPPKPRRHFGGRHSKVSIPHQGGAEEYCTSHTSRQTFPVYDVFEEELRSSITNKHVMNEMGRDFKHHLTGNDGRRADLVNLPKDGEICTTTKPVAETLSNFTITNEPMSSSTVSSNKLVDRSTQTERKFNEFFEMYGKFEPDSRPSMSWDHLTPAPTVQSTKTRGYSVPSATFLG